MIEIRQIESKNDFENAIALQLDVFSGEQGISRSDCLAGNDTALHIVAIEGDLAVGTARITIRHNRTADLARIAVSPAYRDRGLGRRLVQKLEEIARTEGITELELQPHQFLENFYSGLGYSRLGGATKRVGDYDLITMTKSLES